MRCKGQGSGSLQPFPPADYNHPYLLGLLDALVVCSHDVFGGAMIAAMRRAACTGGPSSTSGRVIAFTHPDSVRLYAGRICADDGFCPCKGVSWRNSGLEGIVGRTKAQGLKAVPTSPTFRLQNDSRRDGTYFSSKL